MRIRGGLLVCPVTLMRYISPGAMSRYPPSKCNGIHHPSVTGRRTVGSAVRRSSVVTAALRPAVSAPPTVVCTAAGAVVGGTEGGRFITARWRVICVGAGLGCGLRSRRASVRSAGGRSRRCGPTRRRAALRAVRRFFGCGGLAEAVSVPIASRMAVGVYGGGRWCVICSGRQFGSLSRSTGLPDGPWKGLRRGCVGVGWGLSGLGFLTRSAVWRGWVWGPGCGLWWPPGCL